MKWNKRESFFFLPQPLERKSRKHLWVYLFQPPISATSIDFYRWTMIQNNKPELAFSAGYFIYFHSRKAMSYSVILSQIYFTIVSISLFYNVIIEVFIPTNIFWLLLWICKLESLMRSFCGLTQWSRGRMTWIVLSFKTCLWTDEIFQQYWIYFIQK